MSYRTPPLQEQSFYKLYLGAVAKLLTRDSEVRSSSYLLTNCLRRYTYVCE